MARDAIRWKRIEELYHLALELPESRREAFLTESSPGDQELAREVWALLREDVSKQQFLHLPALQDATVTMNHRGAAEASAAVTAWGPFRLLEKIGEGAFGEVYRARDTKLERDVALKLLRPQDESDYERMLKEARSHARVRHSNIVPIYGADRFDGRVGFWSEFVHGKTLSALLAAQGAFGHHEAAAIGVELCRSLSAVHAAGLLHRDIKTSNAMREEGGRILLMDFGLSHDAAGGGAYGGTPGYMAPELLEGRRASVATDIYALGVLLYRLLTAAYPEDGGRRMPLIERRPDLPPEFVRAVEKAVCADPEGRYRSAGEMMAALQKEQPKAGWWRAAAIAVAVVVLAAAVWSVYGRKGAPSAAVEADYKAAEALSIRYDKPENLEKAVASYRSVLARDPNFALAHVGLCRAWFLRARSVKDLSLLDKAFEECAKAKDRNADLTSVAVTLSLAHTLAGNTDLASQDLQSVIGEVRRPDVQSALCALRDKEGRAADAEQACVKATALAPDDWRWHNQLALLYNRKGDFRRAVQELETVVKLVPDNTNGLLNLGILYMNQERFGEARDALMRASLHPNFSVYLTLSTLSQFEGKYGEAAAFATKAVGLNPTYHKGWGNLGGSLAWSGNSKGSAAAYRKAADLAEKARKQDKEDPIIAVNLGSYYAALRLAALSRPLLAQALALAPNDPQTVLQAGEAFELLGDRERALDLVHRALKLGYPLRVVARDPELAGLRKDPKF